MCQINLFKKFRVNLNCANTLVFDIATRCLPVRIIVKIPFCIRYNWRSLWLNEKSVRQWFGRPGFNPQSKKWYLVQPCLTLSIIRYGSRIKWSNSGREWNCTLTLHLGVVAIEKEAFGSPSTKIVDFSFSSLN